MVEGVYFDPTDTPHDMYEEEYEWEVPIKTGIDLMARKREEKYPCLYTEEEVWDPWEGSSKEPLPSKDDKYQEQALIPIPTTSQLFHPQPVLVNAAWWTDQEETQQHEYLELASQPWWETCSEPEPEGLTNNPWWDMPNQQRNCITPVGEQPSFTEVKEVPLRHKGIKRKEFVIDRGHWECPVCTNDIGHCGHWVCEECQGVSPKDKAYQLTSYKRCKCDERESQHNGMGSRY